MFSELELRYEWISIRENPLYLNTPRVWGCCPQQAFIMCLWHGPLMISQEFWKRQYYYNLTFVNFGTVEKYIDMKLKKLAVMIILGIYIEEICWYKVS